MSWYVAAALLLLIALALDLGLLAYAMYALFSLMLVSRYLTRVWADSLSGERECNRLTANIGDRVAVNITVQNRGALPIPWMLVEDLLPKHALMFDPPSLEVEGRRVLLASLRAGKRKNILYQLRCNRRGYYQLGPLVMETGDLFGLHRRYRVASKPSFLMVYPRVVALEGYELSSRRPIGEVRMSHRLFEDPTRNAGVRAYQAGDPLSRVHWAATARTGKLHSKVYEPSTVAGATIVLDFHRKTNPRRHEPMRSELAVTAAASLASAVYEMGQQVGLITNGRDAADRIRQEGWAYDLRHAGRGSQGRSHGGSKRPTATPNRPHSTRSRAIHADSGVPGSCRTNRRTHVARVARRDPVADPPRRHSGRVAARGPRTNGDHPGLATPSRLRRDRDRQHARSQRLRGTGWAVAGSRSSVKSLARRGRRCRCLPSILVAIKGTDCVGAPQPIPSHLTP